MPFLALIVMRVARAVQVLWILLTDRALARRLPWGYIRGRVFRTPIGLLQLAGLAAALVAWPIGVTQPSPARDWIVGAAVAVWCAALAVPWLLSWRDSRK